MGQNFFGVDEATKYFGVKPTKTELTALARVPWSEDTLKAVKDTHVLVAVFLLSINDIRSKHPELFYHPSWYDKESFVYDIGDVSLSANDKGDLILSVDPPSWQLIRKTPVENSTSKTWVEQQVLLAKNEKTPFANVMVYVVIGHFLATGERLFEHVYIRVSDVDSVGFRVRVGRFDSAGLDIGSGWGGGRGERVGVSSARKSE